jgi:GGDEF domain-containing protein
VNVDVDLLAESPEQLAKRWLLALLASRPLADAVLMPLQRVADQGPQLCALLVSALSSDAQLQQLSAAAAGDPALESPELVAAFVALADTPEPAATVAVVETLRRVLWASLAESVGSMTAAQAGDVADRLAHVCSVLTTAVVAHAGNVAASLAASAGPVSKPESPSDPQQRPRRERAGRSPVADPERYPRIDVRRNGATDAPDEVADAWAIGDLAPAGDQADQPPAAGPQASAGPVVLPDGWIGALGERASGGAVAPTEFAVLLIEVLSAERLLQADIAGEAEALMTAVHDLLRGALRPLDLLEQESAGRWWLLAPAADLAAARRLAERLAETVRATISDRLAPLEVAIGVAASPDHGTGALELGERAEEELYAARAAGVSVMPSTASAVSSD